MVFSKIMAPAGKSKRHPAKSQPGTEIYFQWKIILSEDSFLKTVVFPNHICLLLYVSIKDEGEACQAGPKASFKKENQNAHPQGHNSCSGGKHKRVAWACTHMCTRTHTHLLPDPQAGRLVLTEAVQITAVRSLYWPACSPDQVLALERLTFGRPDGSNTANSCLVSSPGFNRNQNE